MKKGYFTIISNENLTENVYKMVLSGDISAIERPGQFVNIAIDELFLRRPISVCDAEDGKLTIIYKAVGKGTERLAAMDSGVVLDILTGLGNGYFTDFCEKSALLIGGGVGVPPLYKLAKDLLKEGKKVTVVLGFNKADEIFYYEEFKALGVNVLVSTVDGSFGVKGFVTDAIKEVGEYDYVYTCGPLPMLKAVYNSTTTDGSYSFEERMGCGFGACMGCTCKTKNGYKRICKDGPVLFREDIIW